MRTLSIPFFVSILLLVLIAGYGYYNSSALRSGPTIRIDSPLPYSSVPTMVQVSGNVARAKDMTINGMRVPFTTRGDFSATLILTPPLDTIDIWAINAYGKENTKSIEVSITE
jgi:hypothetical protein